MENDPKFQQIVERINERKKTNKFDLSRDEDLSLAVMNLVSLEEHFFYTAEKTGKGEYFDLLKEVREIRKELMTKLLPEHEGETWCISKHLLAASMRLMEVGTKLQTEKDDEEAKKIFDRAYRVYALFWAVRLKVIDTTNIKKINDNQLNRSDPTPAGEESKWTVDDLVSKLVDCCNE